MYIYTHPYCAAENPVGDAEEQPLVGVFDRVKDGNLFILILIVIVTVNMMCYVIGSCFKPITHFKQTTFSF